MYLYYRFVRGISYNHIVIPIYKKKNKLISRKLLIRYWISSYQVRSTIIQTQIQYFSNSAEVICFAFIAIVRFNKWIKLKSFYLNNGSIEIYLSVNSILDIKFHQSLNTVKLCIDNFYILLFKM